MRATWRLGPCSGASSVAAFRHAFLGAAGLAVAAASFYAAQGIAAVAGAGLGLVMLAVAVVDARSLVIPDRLTVIALALGFADVVLETWPEALAPLLAALVRASVMAALFLAFRSVYRRLRGREGIGLGDVKLAGAAGVWLDWPNLPIAIDLAALGALAFLGLAWIRSRRAPDPYAKLPFGAFLAPAIWLCWALQRLWGWAP